MNSTKSVLLTLALVGATLTSCTKKEKTQKPVQEETTQKLSSATIRLNEYKEKNDCTPSIPNDSTWNISFEREDLKGDLAPDIKYTRRDPSSVLKVDGRYYVWYSYSLTHGEEKKAPWDWNDLYYASSEDGLTWTEHGAAVTRGEEGTFDYRSVFTPEVFYDQKDSTFYLIYQAAKNLEGIYDKNTIAISHSKSPKGPWTKLDKSILEPSKDSTAFDGNAVHDPCIVAFKDKYYLYYKGEGIYKPTCGIGIWGLDKQVKWGVAVADKPTGPYIKSEYNPITNTGHEVCVWNSGEGIAIMLHQDGPEYGTIQYAKDGVNFDIKGKVESFVLRDYTSGFPEAAGVYQPVGEEKSPVTGVSWGLNHVLKNEEGGYWMYMQRYESTNKDIIVKDEDIPGIVTE